MQHVLVYYMCVTFIQLLYTQLFSTGADFYDETFTFKVDGESTEMGLFLIRLENVTIDDDIDESEQSFVLVAELGDDVPENFVCFQRQMSDTQCFGRTGSTEIRIMDNDGK